ncbi:MAG: aminotransferase class V-fold PLP-dependent enzyme [Rhodospirillales bacterium]|nr:aminotransferase class V-fold PLP-dependent enzyme [Rhodospirillales bacterium]
MPRNVNLDMDFVRGFFPALNDSWSFFENAGGTFVPTTVIERVRAYMSECQVYHGAEFAQSREATARITAGKDVLAGLIGAAPDEIVIGPSTTNNVYVLAHALRPWFAEGDEIIVTNQDHEANSGAWRRYAETGLTVREWRMDPETGELRPEDLAALLGDWTRLVCFTACSNIVGTIYDAAAICRMVHDAGALACVDGVAFAPHRLVDVKAMDADFFLYSVYKIFGPHAAVLYAKPEHLARVHNQNHYFVEGNPALMLSPGGPNHELTAGAVGIRDYFDRLHDHHFGDEPSDGRGSQARMFDLFAEHEARLAAPLADYLAGRKGVRLFGRANGKADERVSVFSFVVEGRDSAAIAGALQADGFAVKSGDFYAARCIDALGTRPQNGVIRAAMVHYNTEAEVHRLIERLDREIENGA